MEKKKSHVSEFFYFNRLYNGQHVFKFPEHGSLTKMTLTPLRYTKMALRWGMKVFHNPSKKRSQKKNTMMTYVHNLCRQFPKKPLC